MLFKEYIFYTHYYCRYIQKKVANFMKLFLSRVLLVPIFFKIINNRLNFSEIIDILLIPDATQTHRLNSLIH